MFFSPEPLEVTKDGKIKRSLSFSSLFPLSISSRRGKLKISKYGSNCSLNKVMEKTEDSEQFAKHGEDMFNKTVLEDIEEAESVTRRLSIVVNEIEEFEREFIYPMKSVSSSNISEASRPRRTKRSTPKASNKYYSTTTLGSSKLGSIFHSSTDSVYSEHDSGAYSRESTPDFSLMSSITDVSEPLISPSLVMAYTIKSINRPSKLSAGEKFQTP